MAKQKARMPLNTESCITYLIYKTQILFLQYHTVVISLSVGFTALADRRGAGTGGGPACTSLGAMGPL